MDNTELLKIAIESTKYSYSPYSHYSVGAALLTDDNLVYTGCNVENASFSATNCAERTAFYKAISDGKRKFIKIAVVAIKDGVIDKNTSPCGVCRQVMSEFCDDDFLIITATSETEYNQYTLSQLLPNSFTNNNFY